MNLTKKEFKELVISLEIRELITENGYGQNGELTDSQSSMISFFQKMQHKIYVHAKDYDCQDEFEIHPDTSLLAVKQDSKLEEEVFKAAEKQEKAITYEMIVRHLISKKAQEMSALSAPQALEFAALTAVVQAMAEKIYGQLEKNGLDAVLLDAALLNKVENLKIMKHLFKLLSESAIKLDSAKFTPKQINSKWIGNQGTSKNQIKQTEQRLHIELPKDYKELLEVTNGFAAPNDVEPSFLRVEKINFLKNIDPNIIDAYSIKGIEDTGKALERSILVGGLNEEQYFLLIPPKNKLDSWQYWKFANWIPGKEAYENLKNYFENVVKFNIFK